MSKKQLHAFSLVELLVVLAIFSLVAAMIVTSFVSYGVTQEFQTVRAETTTLLREARQRTLTSETVTQFGVHVDTTTIIVFEGSSFATGTVRSEFTSPNATFSSSFSDGNNEIVFARLTGLPSATGTVLLTQTRSGATTTVEILDNGMVQ